MVADVVRMEFISSEESEVENNKSKKNIMSEVCLGKPRLAPSLPLELNYIYPLRLLDVNDLYCPTFRYNHPAPVKSFKGKEGTSTQFHHSHSRHGLKTRRTSKRL